MNHGLQRLLLVEAIRPDDNLISLLEPEREHVHDVRYARAAIRGAQEDAAGVATGEFG